MTLKFTDLSKRLQEAKDDTVVFAFGRFNPMTIGHAKLMKKVEAEGSKAKDHFVYASHSVDNKKNPLEPKFKKKILARAFPRNNIEISSKSMPTALHIASALSKKGYKNLVMVAGSDRVSEFQKLLDTYNGTKGRHGEYKFDTIKVVSAGARDADAGDASGASGTKMREYAARNDYENFAKYSPEGLSDREIKSVFNAVRKKMPKLDNEQFEPIAVREEYLLGKLFEVGDTVYDLNEGAEYEIVECGTNFVYCKGEDGNVYTKWLSDVGELNEVRQDSDIKDKEGTQPAKYYAGLKSKSTKSARDAHFKKGAKKSDDDPSAYEPAPGDADAKTKPSKHTKKFKQMFGEVQETEDEQNGNVDRLSGIGFRQWQMCDEQAEIAFEVDIEGIGTMLVAGKNKQEIKQRLQKMFRDARKFSIGKRMMSPQIKMWYRSQAGDKSKVDEAYEIGKDYADHTKEVTPGQSVGEKTYLRRHKTLKNLKVPVTKKSGRIIKKGDKPFKDEFEIDERTLTPAEKEKLKKLEKDVPKKDFIDRYGDEGESVYYATLTKMAKGESLWDNIRKKRERIAQGSGEKMRKVGDKGAPTSAQMQRAKDASEEFEDWDIDIFLEEDVTVTEDADLEKELEDVIDKYDELEDVEDIYPDIDGDGDHDDEDWSNMSSNDGMQRTVIDDNYKWVDEVLTPAQRFKRSQQMRRLKGKIQRARAISLKRPSSPDKLQKRAQRHARNLIRKKFIKGKNYNDLSFAEKQAVEKKMQGKAGLINRIAMRVKPKLKKLEQERLRNMNKQESRLIESNIYRVGSELYYETFNDWKKSIDRDDLDSFDRELLESDIGSFAMYEGNHVPLDCPMIEEEKQPELNKPKAGGPKKYYVYVKDPSSGNIKKVSWGDTTGLKIKLNDPEARKSFSARHNCPAKKDKTKPGYWACRMPYYAKQLGLSGGGNFFW